MLDDVVLTTCIDKPGTVSCIVMRNYDQVRKYHIEPLLRRFPVLENYLNKSEGNLRIPTRDGRLSQIDFSYAENLNDVERRFRSANYYIIALDQAEQFRGDELIEMKKGCRSGDGMAKMLLSFNMGGIGIQELRKWFHTREFNERQNPDNYAFVHFFTWDNAFWCQHALAQDGLTEKDYYSWTDEQRRDYCATRSAYGRELNSQDDALRNRDWFASWDCLEGAYFARVFDADALFVDQEQVWRLLKPWDKLWISGDWGKAHYCAHLWHGRTTVSPADAAEILGWTISKPVRLTLTFHEKVVNEMSSSDVGRLLVAETNRFIPSQYHKQIRRYVLSPDAFGERDSSETIAYLISKQMRLGGLPQAEPADTDRAGGWGLMYNLMQATKRRGETDGECWLISGQCPELQNALPALLRDPKNLDVVLKTDLGRADITQDVSESARYGLKSELSPGVKPKLQVLNETLSQQTGMARLKTILTFDKQWKETHKGISRTKRYH